MRILIPITDFGRGGGFRVLSRLASEWSKSAEVSFLAPWFAAEPYYPTDADTVHVDLRGRCTRRATRELAGLLRVSQAQLALTRGLRRQARTGDVLLSNHFLTTLAANAAEREGVTHVRLMQATEADYYPGGGLRSRGFRALARRADSRAPYVLVNSPEFLWGDPRRVGVLPPGVDRDIFHPVPGDHDGIVLGTIGREEPWKGTNRVLESVRRCRLPAGARIAVANFGADLGRFRDLPLLVSTPGNDRELAAWYQSLDLYVVGGYGQPGAYHYPCLESLACGVPLVTPWYRPADDSNAWLVDSTEPTVLANRIREALDDDRGRMRRRRAGLAAAEALSWPRLAQESLEILRHLASAEDKPDQ